ncbi:uncharacterized protein LOC116029079 [Ipomoea triloba]|uniref:uncharacterized protein LOC116029079 n=1 Tax=Ipomoea triloba TaxID=35885 RepID=UPI00125CF23B|nr:uncharacterized protein LOC116029079 [Ipomoea triloba]
MKILERFSRESGRKTGSKEAEEIYGRERGGEGEEKAIFPEAEERICSGRRKMKEISVRGRSFRLILFFYSILLQFVSGFSDNPPGPKNETKVDAHTTSGNGSGSEILVIFIVIIVFGLLVFFLFKVWQKKKREDQYARLLKLFEEDDELELELGLRD